MGYLPDWYLMVRAARYLGVAPWELEERPALWAIRALVAQRAEAGAEAAQLQELVTRR